MPGPPVYGLHQARDASLQAAKPEHAIGKDTPSVGLVLDERKDIGAQNSACPAFMSRVQAVGHLRG